jgi:hypothetical protein
LILAYSVVFMSVAARSGIPYAEWFATGASAFRTAVLPLLSGAVLIVAFLAWARWEGSSSTSRQRHRGRTSE